MDGVRLIQLGDDGRMGTTKLGTGHPPRSQIKFYSTLCLVYRLRRGQQRNQVVEVGQAEATCLSSCAAQCPSRRRDGNSSLF